MDIVPAILIGQVPAHKPSGQGAWRSPAGQPGLLAVVYVVQLGRARAAQPGTVCCCGGQLALLCGPQPQLETPRPLRSKKEPSPSPAPCSAHPTPGRTPSPPPTTTRTSSCWTSRTPPAPSPSSPHSWPRASGRCGGTGRPGCLLGRKGRRAQAALAHGFDSCIARSWRLARGRSCPALAAAVANQGCAALPGLPCLRMVMAHAPMWW